MMQTDVTLTESERHHAFALDRALTVGSNEQTQARALEHVQQMKRLLTPWPEIGNRSHMYSWQQSPWD